MTIAKRYETPRVQRFGSFRELTRLGSECGGFLWWSYGCSDHVPGESGSVGGGGDGGGGDRS